MNAFMVGQRVVIITADVMNAAVRDIDLIVSADSGPAATLGVVRISVARVQAAS